MAVTKTLNFKFVGDASAAIKSIHGIQASTEKLAGGFEKLGGIIGIAFGAKAIFDFGKESVNAFLEAEDAQNKLADAFKRFPALADSNQKALDKLNATLALKTGYDDDATASAQAVLAQFGLTGKQLEKLTPLLQDYARKTGQLLPDAATSLGKALLGQGRALKEVGIEFKDTGTVAGNFDELVSGLTDKVGGYAESWGGTTAGKFQILQTRLGEIQESIGQALLPVLDKLATMFTERVLPGLEGAGNYLAESGLPAFQKFTTFVDDNATALGIATGAMGGLTAAQWLLNIAMDANPVGAFTLALGSLIVMGTLVATNYNEISKVIYSTFGAVEVGLLSIAIGVVSAINSVVNGLLSALQPVVGAINAILGLVGMHINFPVSLDVSPGLQSFQSNLNRVFDAGKMGGVNAVNNNGASLSGSSSIPTFGGSPSSSGGGGGTRPKLATGALIRATPGGTDVTVGEGGVDEAVIPLSRAGLSSAGVGGQTTFVLSGIMTTNRTETAKLIRQLWQEQIKQGTIPRGSLA